MKQKIGIALKKKTPVLVVCGVVFVALTVFLSKRIYSFNEEDSALMSELFAMESLLESKEMWNARAEWIGERIPRFDTQNDAAHYLLRNLRGSLTENHLKFEDHFIHPRIAPTVVSLNDDGSYDRARLDITIRGREKDIVKWIHEIQEPGNFAGIDELEIELADFDLLCRLQISQWYVGNNRSFNPGQHHQPEVHYISPDLADSR